MNALVALLALAQPASQPASQANVPGGGKASDVTASMTMILEVDEHHLKTQESWTLQNSSGKRVDAGDLVFPLPDGTRRARIDEDVTGFVAEEDGSAIRATADLGPGQSTFAGAYFWDFDGDTARFSRPIPVNVNGLRVIIENVEGLEVDSNVRYQRRIRDLNGLSFAIYDFAPVRAGQSFELTLSGLPNRTTLPRTAAVALALGIVGWAGLQLVRGRSEDEDMTLGPLSAQARRDQIVKALELLERDREAERITAKRYERRHEELMRELADVLREIDLAEARPRRG